jgi:hypothetical protein
MNTETYSPMCTDCGERDCAKPDECSIRETYSQGVRCGHGDGWGRAGSYVTGEETLLAEESFVNGFVPDPDTCSPETRTAWLNGYTYGYKIGAEGTRLPTTHQYPVERKPTSWD